MLLARVALAININVASLFQAFTLVCRELKNVVKHAFLVLIFGAKNWLVLIFTLFATMGESLLSSPLYQEYFEKVFLRKLIYRLG